MAATNSKPSYWIQYGLAEGRLNSRRLEHQLHTAGFSSADKASKATVVISHSGGCLLHVTGKHVMINPTVWPERSFVRKFLNNLVHDLLLENLLWGMWYLVTHFAYNIRLYRPYLLSNRPQFHSNETALIIRNDQDGWCSPMVEKIYPKAEIKHLPGSHNDCWRHPEEYVKLIVDYAK
ncbi:MAG TPA: hypothetical protein VG604_00790 [Candidatus Saccharimonadales bacterium]|nr:hypothetical protein [Candidatus Saccharimonadales bacterium]